MRFLFWRVYNCIASKCCPFHWRPDILVSAPMIKETYSYTVAAKSMRVGTVPSALNGGGEYSYICVQPN